VPEVTDPTSSSYTSLQPFVIFVVLVGVVMRLIKRRRSTDSMQEKEEFET